MRTSALGLIAVLVWSSPTPTTAPGEPGPDVGGVHAWSVEALTPPPEPGTFAWPVVGPVLRPFDPPDTPFGSGHRGIDIAVTEATPILAPAPGAVAFAGPVAGSLFVTLDHGGGIETTYSWLSSIAVRRGDVVEAGSIIGATGTGHAGDLPAHLHLGARLDGEYVDPLWLLVPLDVSALIRLAPLLPAAT